MTDGYYEITYPDGTHHRTQIKTVNREQVVLVGRTFMQVYMWLPVNGYTMQDCTYAPIETTEAERQHIQSLLGKRPDEVWRNLMGPPRVEEPVKWIDMRTGLEVEEPEGWRDDPRYCR